MQTQTDRIMWLAPQHPALSDVIERGQWQDGAGQHWAAQPQAIEADGRVRIALTPPRLASSASPKTWAKAMRLPSLTAALTPCVAVWLYGLGQGWAANVLTAAAAIFGAMCLQLAVNLLNDAEDHARLIDLPGTLGGSGVIQTGELTASQIRRAAYALLFLGLIAGLPALLRAPVPMFAIGAVAALGAWGYSTGPGLKYKALGDITVAALCGPGLTLGFSFAAFGNTDATVWSIGLVFGLAAVAILHVNNFQDITADKARGAITVAGLIGTSGSRLYLVALYALALVAWTIGALWSGLTPAWSLALPWIAAIPAGKLTYKMLTLPPSDPTLHGARWQAAQAHLLLGLGVCAALLVHLIMS